MEKHVLIPCNASKFYGKLMFKFVLDRRHQPEGWCIQSYCYFGNTKVLISKHLNFFIVCVHIISPHKSSFVPNKC